MSRAFTFHGGRLTDAVGRNSLVAGFFA